MSQFTTLPSSSMWSLYAHNVVHTTIKRKFTYKEALREMKYFKRVKKAKI